MSSLQQAPAKGQQVPPPVLIDGVSEQQIDEAVKAHVRGKRAAQPTAAHAYSAGDIPQEALGEAVKRTLGAYPEDIVDRMRTASDVLEWMSDILSDIRDEAKSGRPDALVLSRILRRTDRGKYLADDFANLLDCWREEMAGVAKAVGIKCEVTT